MGRCLNGEVILKSLSVLDCRCTINNESVPSKESIIELPKRELVM